MISKTNLTGLALVLVFAFASINISQAFDQPSVGPNAPAWDGDFQTNILGNNNDSNKFSSANVVENADGSILERLQFIQSKLTANPVFDDKFTITDDPSTPNSVFQFLTTQITEGAESFRQAILKIGSNESSLKNALTISSDVNDTIKVGVGITDTPTATLDVDGSIKLRGVSCPADTNGNKLTVDGLGNVVCSKDVSVVGADPEVSTLDNVVANNAGVIEGLASSTSNGTDLRIKSLEAGTNIALTADNDTVTITNTFSEDDPKVGSLNNNMIPKWNSVGNLIDSSINDDGSVVSVGDRLLRSDRTVNGNSIIGAGPGSNFQLSHDGSNYVNLLNSSANSNSSGFNFLDDDGVTSNFTITNAGRVGVGVASPATSLEVSYAGVQSGGINGIRIDNTNGKAFTIQSGIEEVDDNGFSITDVDAGANRFTIDADGNIGVGETNPATKMHINTGGDLDPLPAVWGLAVSNTETSSSSTRIGLYGGNAAPVEFNFGDDEDYDIGAIRYENSQDRMVFRVNDSDQVTINSGGEVGLGIDPVDSVALSVAGKKNYYINKSIAGATITEDAQGVNYILLHKAYNGTLMNNNYVMGEITANRGNIGGSNIKMSTAVNTATAYNSTIGSAVSYLNKTSYLVTLTYNSDKYIALALPNGSSISSFDFTGYHYCGSGGDCMTLVYNEDVSNVVDIDERPVTVENLRITKPWQSIVATTNFLTSTAKCRRVGDWIEFRGSLTGNYGPVWTTNTEVTLPADCTPSTNRYTETPCHLNPTGPSSTDRRNGVCNIDYKSDGSAGVYSDAIISQIRFEGLRIWGGAE